MTTQDIRFRLGIDGAEQVVRARSNDSRVQMVSA